MQRSAHLTLAGLYQRLPAPLSDLGAYGFAIIDQGATRFLQMFRGNEESVKPSVVAALIKVSYSR